MLRGLLSTRTILYATVVYVASGCVAGDPLGPPDGNDPSDPPAFTSVSPATATLDVTVGGTIAFEVAAESPDGTPVTVSWSVNGEARSTGTRFVFEPAAPGTYVVAAIASNGERETRREWTVQAAPAPNRAPTAVLALDPASGEAPLDVRIRLSGEDPDGTVETFRIEISGDLDWTIERAAPVDTTLTLAAGTYDVLGRVEDDDGERTVSTATIVVSPAPNRAPVPLLDVDPVAGMAPLDVVIDGGGSDPDGRIVRYALDLTGDGAFDIESDSPLVQSIRYTEAGQVWVRLEVTDDDGAVARDSVLVRVSAANPPPGPPPANQAPNASLLVTPTTGEAPLAVHGKVTGTDPDGTVASVSIDFDGDGVVELQSGSSGVEGDFTYVAAGTYTVVARVVDDAGASATATATVTVSAPPDSGGGSNLPPTGSLGADRTSGDAMLSVVLSGTGSDPDGTVTGLEIDPGDGRGFVDTPGGQLAVDYGFRETPYATRLRITDDAGATTVVDGPAITVHRPVDGSRSTASATGNSRFDGLAIAPAIWADGQDRLRFTVTVRDHAGLPLSGVPVQVTSLRPALVAPDGTNLGDPVTVALDAATSDGSGRVTGSVTTRTSTRVEGVPATGSFTPFDLKVEADAGHGVWRRLPDVSGLNAETVVDGTSMVGSFFVKPAGLTCVGQPLEIHVQALRRADAPGAGGPADGLYTEIRYSFNGQLLDVSPMAGYADWRTDSGGWIRFAYTPQSPDNKAIRAWVDGQPIAITAAIAAVDCP